MTASVAEANGSSRCTSYDIPGCSGTTDMIRKKPHRLPLSRGQACTDSWYFLSLDRKTSAALRTPVGNVVLSFRTSSPSATVYFVQMKYVCTHLQVCCSAAVAPKLGRVSENVQNNADLSLAQRISDQTHRMSGTRKRRGERKLKTNRVRKSPTITPRPAVISFGGSLPLCFRCFYGDSESFAAQTKLTTPSRAHLQVRRGKNWCSHERHDTFRLLPTRCPTA